MARQLVTYAKVHQDIFIPSAGVLSANGTLPPVNKSFEKFTMSVSDNGLLIEIKLRNCPKDRRVVIPFANVALMELGDKEE